MLPNNDHRVLLASNDPALLACFEPLIAAAGLRAQIVLSAEAALAALAGPLPPSLGLLDALLPGMQSGDLMHAVRRSSNGHLLALVMLADDEPPEWHDWLATGILDDLIPRTPQMSHFRVRLDCTLRGFHRMRQLDILREAVALNAQKDPLTGMYNRATLLSMLFRETDRVQRLKIPMALLLFDIDDFGHWNGRLGHEVCDDLLCQAAERVLRQLRSYDLLGRAGNDEFLAALPGCDQTCAVKLAERLRDEVFSTPFHVAGASIRLSACFGIAGSDGRSPVVVLRDAEAALQCARRAGPESIHCAGTSHQTLAGPIAFLSSSAGDELLGW
jgi:two-component system cell cycle response regulator